MHHITTTSGRRSAAAALLILLLACIGLAACGGSSSGSSSGTAASTKSASSSTGPGAKGPNASRFSALRECLQKNGVTLPKRTPGRRPGGAGGFLGAGAAGAGPKLPKGVTRAQYEATIKKCGGGNFAGGGFAGGGARRFNSPVFKAALVKFASCLRSNGVNVPTPNTSGKGPIFSTKGIDTKSAQFKTAEAKCQSTLSQAFRGGAGRPGPGGAGAPPAGGGSQPRQ